MGATVTMLDNQFFGNIAGIDTKHQKIQYCVLRILSRIENTDLLNGQVTCCVH